MNYTMGRYIDELTDEQRDLLVQAEDFTDGWEWWYDGCGCLVGTVYQGDIAACGNSPSLEWWLKHYHLGGEWAHKAPHIRYPKAVARFGKARVVRAIKMRAAATTSRREEERVERAHAAARKRMEATR